jgi:hypothetical protein
MTDRSTDMKPSRREDVSGLSDAELAEQGGEELPDREAMSLINANVAAPVNLALAANVASDNSTAIAEANQTAPIEQVN